MPNLATEKIASDSDLAEFTWEGFRHWQRAVM
jgi:hypothetical protein